MGYTVTTGLHYPRLTFIDLQRSRTSYTEVLGFGVAAESPGEPADPAVRADPAQLYGGVAFAINGILFGPRPVAPDNDAFVAERIGLDHVSFAVASRADLDDAAARLQARGIEHGELQELPGFGRAILSFSDPDGVNLELTSPLS